MSSHREFMSNAMDITDATFESEVISSDVPVVVDFGLLGCGPCRKLGPVLDEVSEELKDKIKVVKINTDENLKRQKNILLLVFQAC